jgi:hypothetical protein
MQGKPLRSNRKGECKMMNIRMSLVDNDYVVRAKTELPFEENNDNFKNFFKEINEELVIGKTAHLEVEGPGIDPIIYEISRFE